jgi:hypothetical protein
MGLDPFITAEISRVAHVIITTSESRCSWPGGKYWGFNRENYGAFVRLRDRVNGKRYEIGVLNVKAGQSLITRSVERLLVGDRGIRKGEEPRRRSSLIIGLLIILRLVMGCCSMSLFSLCSTYDEIFSKQIK